MYLSTDLHFKKKHLRQQIKARKSQLPAEILIRDSALIMHRLRNHPRFLSARTVLLFSSLPDEPSTLSVLVSCLNDKRLLLPVVKDDDMYVKEFRGIADLSGGAFGIAEPSGPYFLSYSEIDLVVVPGVAFDHTGRRLGRGRGYYDRFLAQPEFGQTYKIGVCFPFQLVDTVPAEPWDVQMDEVISC